MAGADESLWQKHPCVVSVPSFPLLRQIDTGLNTSRLKNISTTNLWKIHKTGMEHLNQSQFFKSQNIPENTVNLLDLKIELATRLLSSCTICERRCKADRIKGEIGFCGLTDAVQVSAYSNLYNEGPLVGAPTFAIFVRGCSLRCSFCYRPQEREAKISDKMLPEELSNILDNASIQGARSWHFLGGNPDESLPSILRVLSLTKYPLPIIWNSALMLTPESIELLKGIVDIWLPDFKFGQNSCARDIACIDDYIKIITRNLAILRNEKNVVV